MTEKSLRHKNSISKTACLLLGKLFLGILLVSMFVAKAQTSKKAGATGRERISINNGWKFMRHAFEPDKLIYVTRPEVANRKDDKVADSKPAEAVLLAVKETVSKLN